MKKRKPSKQAGNLTKRESNKGDYKGTFIKIDKTYMTYLNNIVKSHKSKEQKADLELSIFFKLWIDCRKRNLSTKEMQHTISEIFKKNGFRFSRSKFFRLIEKVEHPLAEIARQSRKQYESDKKRRVSKEDFEKAISSPTIKKISLQEDAELAKQDVEDFFRAKGMKIKSGTLKGSKKGGITTKKKNI